MIILHPNEEAVPGQILWSDNNKNIKRKHTHHMLYIGEDSNRSEYFIGVMLTSTNRPPYTNIEIPGQYFKTNLENGEQVEFPTKPTFFRSRRFLKKNDWKPFRVTGQLTTEGLAFVVKNLSTSEPALNEFNALVVATDDDQPNIIKQATSARPTQPSK